MSTNDRVIWQAYPSWNQFAWLYLASLTAGSRSLRLFWQGASGWEVWLGGAIALLLCAACLRQWAQYLLTSTRVAVRNGYSGRDIQAIRFDDIAEITLSQGPIARFFNIGTLAIHSTCGSHTLLWQGVNNPEIIKRQLEARRP
jgi:membrane protein YdbS with pleckstrin-like domain